MRALTAVAALLVTIAFVGCRDEASPAGAPLESRRSGAAERESYRPPADGVLTAAQVETFLKVREATVRSRAIPPEASAPPAGEDAISDATRARAAEIRAARALSVPVEEYLWVRERIVEAEAAAQTAKLNSDILALLEKTLASLRNRRPAAPDDASRQLLDEQISTFEAEAARVRREAAEKDPEAVRANLKVLAPFRQKLSAIADDLAALDGRAKPAPSAAPR